MSTQKKKISTQQDPDMQEPVHQGLTIHCLSLEKRTHLALYFYNVTQVNIFKSTRVEILESTKQKIIDRMDDFHSTEGAEKDVRRDLVEAIASKIPAIVLGMIAVGTAIYQLVQYIMDILT